MTGGPYTAAFYSDELSQSAPSARRIVPILQKLVSAQSVLDVGCGRGDFLRAFLDAGVTDILGLDGVYVPPDQLVIDPSAFRPTDLAKGFDLGRRYDLVLSLEVAEHLPASAADVFLASLVRHGSVIVFSAAIPGQGGTAHLNEQWQIQWANAFIAQGFKPYDVIRPLIWNDQQIAYWYRQNTLIYATDAAASASTMLSEIQPLPPTMVNLVHPLLYLQQAQRAQSLENQIASLQSCLQQTESFDVEHSSDGRMVITPKQN